MKNVNMMYLRPGNLFKQFIVESSKPVRMKNGRLAAGHTGDGTFTLMGCLAEASDEDRTNHSCKEHVGTHTIVQPGKPMAKITDKLVLGERAFYIVDIDDTGALGLSTIYYAEERKDVK